MVENCSWCGDPVTKYDHNGKSYARTLEIGEVAYRACCNAHETAIRMVKEEGIAVEGGLLTP